MSGWENIPKETPARTPKRSTAASDVSETATPDPNLIDDGELLRAIEWYFPAIWLVMLFIVCFIGVYSAIGKLPNSPW